MAAGTGLVRRVLARRRETTADLVAAARARDEGAMMELIERCERVIAAGLASAGLRPGEPLYPDARNQALFSIWQNFASYRGAGEPCAWMYRVARRSAASRTIDPEIRERRRQGQHQVMTPRGDLIAPSGEAAVADNDLLAQVLAQLSPDDREILVLRVVQELSTKATAELLFLSEAGVKSRLHRARKAAAAIAMELEAMP